MYIFFFFQAEDGIRAGHVTGVQTCALPISPSAGGSSAVRVDSRQSTAVMLTHPLGDAAGGGYTYLRTLKVPEGFPSLATAAAAAINGSRIELGPGEHRLALSIARLRLEIVGTAGARATTLVKDARSVGLRLSAGADVTLRGVTVTAVQGAPPGSGILVGSGCRLQLEAAAMTGNFSPGAGAAITVAGEGRLEVSRSRLTGNDSLEAGGAIA